MCETIREAHATGTLVQKLHEWRHSEDDALHDHRQCIKAFERSLIHSGATDEDRAQAHLLIKGIRYGEMEGRFHSDPEYVHATVTRFLREHYR